MQKEETSHGKVQLKKPQLPRADFNRRADAFLKKIQEKLMPEHADELIAINMETGEYVLSKAREEVISAFLARWPDTLMFLCRVDGGPSTKFHGR
jgi:hypothetical protein